MDIEKNFDVLIVVTSEDCQRLISLYPRLIGNYRYGKLCFIGPKKVAEVVDNNDAISEASFVVDENAMILFDDVHSCMAEKLKDILKSREMPRAVTGWYYQQFLKMQYSAVCEDEYYMVWDGDTIPCREINMFQTGTGKPYLDMKHEYHPEYFETISRILPGFRKVIDRSFISEHMLIRVDIMQNLIKEIEKNDSIPGTKFWEKIINSIPPEKITDSSFSEFETYGTYVALKYPDVYKLRDWHSFRLGSQFFSIESITDRDFEWLGKDFDAISFEKNQPMIGDGNSFMNDPEYQKKLSAKQMLQAIQMEFNGGYKEIWADDPVTMKNANIKKGGFETGKGVDNRTLFIIVDNGNPQMLQFSMEGIKDSLSEFNYKIVTTDRRLPFYKAVNQAVGNFDGTEYGQWDICVLKSGTRILFDSIHFLKHAIYSEKDVGAAGSVSNLAGNKQKLYVEFDTPQEYISFGEKNNVLMEDPYLERVSLSSYAMLIKREAFDKVGGFEEAFEMDGLAGDADFSLKLLTCGYRLRLVRNSFVYRQCWDEYEDALESGGEKLRKLLYANPNIISQITFGKEEEFNVLDYSCGLGANLKAIRSLYPNVQTVGIETDTDVADIAGGTEKIFGSIDELMRENQRGIYDLLLISPEDFENLDDNAKISLGQLCTPEFKIIAK